MYPARYEPQRFWNYGPFPSTAEVSGFLDYQLHIEGTDYIFKAPYMY
jgi:hypothetical protein